MLRFRAVKTSQACLGLGSTRSNGIGKGTAPALVDSLTSPIDWLPPPTAER
jgi:hypothetical protein